MSSKEQIRSVKNKMAVQQPPHPTTSTIEPLDQRLDQADMQSARPDPKSLTPNRVLQLQSTIGNQNVQRLLSEKSPEGSDQGNVDDLLKERILQAEGDGNSEQTGPASPAPAAAANAKTAGVDYFDVTWDQNANAGETNASLRLDYNAKFAKDSTHDPALAEFRQSVMTTYSITDGPHKGRQVTTAPMHDDNYSRADDLNGNAITDVNFYSNDNPGVSPIDKDDVIDYSFTAEETIIDTSQDNKVIAKKGPHTGKIKGKHPRTYDGVPLSIA